MLGWLFLFEEPDAAREFGVAGDGGEEAVRGVGLPFWASAGGVDDADFAVDNAVEDDDVAGVAGEVAVLKAVMVVAEDGVLVMVEDVLENGEEIIGGLDLVRGNNSEGEGDIEVGKDFVGIVAGVLDLGAVTVFRSAFADAWVVKEVAVFGWDDETEMIG